MREKEIFYPLPSINLKIKGQSKNFREAIMMLEKLASEQGFFIDRYYYKKDGEPDSGFSFMTKMGFEEEKECKIKCKEFLQTVGKNITEKFGKDVINKT